MSGAELNHAAVTCTMLQPASKMKVWLKQSVMELEVQTATWEASSAGCCFWVLGFWVWAGMAEGWESSFLAWAFGLLAGALHCALPANRLRESCILYCNQLILLRKLFLAHLIFCLNDAFLCVGFPSLLCWDNREVNLLGRLTLLIFCFKPFHPFLFLESLGS